MTTSVEAKKAAVEIYMKTLEKTAGMVLNMLTEGHSEAAKMLQEDFCDQFADAVAGMNDVFHIMDSIEEGQEEEPELDSEFLAQAPLKEPTKKAGIKKAK